MLSRYTPPSWNWIDEGLLPYALAGMRSLWIWTLLLLWSLFTNTELLLSLPVVFALLAGSTLAAQIGTYALRSPASAAALVVFGGLATLLALLYLRYGGAEPIWDPTWLLALGDNALPAIATMPIAIFAWWWGIHAGRQRVYYETYLRNFTFGLAVLGLALGLSYASRWLDPAVAMSSLMIFFAAGAATLAIAGVQQARSMDRSRGGQGLHINRYWLGSVGVVILFLLLGGLLVSQVFTGDVVDGVRAALNLVLGVLGRILLVIILIISYPIMWLLSKLLESMADRMPVQPPRELMEQRPLEEQIERVENAAATLSPQAVTAIRIGVIALLILGVALIFYLAYKRLTSSEDEDVEESRELILSSELLREQLSEFFRRRRRKTPAEPPPYALVTGEDVRAQIRRTYQELLQWAAEQGLPRRPGQTPTEYAIRVSREMPAHAAEIEAITAVYLQARYTGGPMPAQSGAQARAAWISIRQGEAPPA